LSRYFDFHEPLTEHNAKKAWNQCNEVLQSGTGARKLIQMSNAQCA
ncbi:MAG: glucuronate isomerase, partial [Methanomicrobiales archaeon]|nr:glucuronate isomerase [Methanomicrobiales archaeon]